MTKLKTFVLGAFLLFAGCAFFFGQQTHAENESVLQAVADYKNWQQVNKKTDDKPSLEITNSMPMG